MMTQAFRRSFLLVVWGGVFLALISVHAANPVVVLPDGRRVEGKEVRAAADGTIVLILPEGGRLEYPKGTKVIMDEPVEMAQALERMRKKEFDEAIRQFQGIVEQYRYLGWDLRAMKFIGLCQVELGRWDEAIRSLDAAAEGAADLTSDETVRVALARALAGAGRRDRLDPLLDEMIRKGTRREAAAAQVIRGRLRLDGGDLEGALYDFMRTARFFREIREWIPEAAWRAGETFDRMGVKEASLEFYRQAGQYPETEFGKRARARLEKGSSTNAESSGT